MYGKGVLFSEKFCMSGKNFWTPKMVHWPKFFWRRGGGGGRKKCVPQKIISGLVGHNPKKSGKFISAPLIFSFPYAHGCARVVMKLSTPSARVCVFFGTIFRKHVFARAIVRMQNKQVLRVKTRISQRNVCADMHKVSLWQTTFHGKGSCLYIICTDIVNFHAKIKSHFHAVAFPRGTVVFPRNTVPLYI
jgi:hypothetical protein